MAQQAAFIFDMDGTLVDSMPFHLQAWIELLAERGERTTPETFLRQTGGKTNRNFVLEGLAIAPYFSTVVGVEEIHEGKPHPEIFLRAAERLGVAPADCLVFEDAIAGIKAASRAGMKAMALATTADAREFRNLPTVIQVAKDFTSLSAQSLLALLDRVR